MLHTSNLLQPLNPQGNVRVGRSSRSLEMSRPGNQAYDVLKKNINTLNPEDLSQRAFDVIVNKTNNRETAFKEFTHLFVKIGEKKTFSTPIDQEKGVEIMSEILRKIDDRFPFETPLSGDLREVRTSSFSNYLKNKFERSEKMTNTHFRDALIRGYGSEVILMIALGITTGGTGFIVAPLVGVGIFANHGVKMKNALETSRALKDVVSKLPEELDASISSPLHFSGIDNRRVGG